MARAIGSGCLPELQDLQLELEHMDRDSSMEIGQEEWGDWLLNTLSQMGHAPNLKVIEVEDFISSGLAALDVQSLKARFAKGGVELVHRIVGLRGQEEDGGGIEIGGVRT